MPQDIQRPFDFQDGGYVSADELHNYLEQATILPGFIGEKGAETVLAPNDEILIRDVSHDRLRKMTYENFAAAGGLDPRSNSHTVLQNNHGFSVGNVLYWGGTQYKKAKAEDSAAKIWIGIVRAVIDPNTFIMTTSGFVNALSGLVSATTYYLSPDTAGAYTSTRPTGLTPVIPVMIAISATEAYLLGTHQQEPGDFVTGDLKITMRNIALPGWLMLDGSTLGKDLSAASHTGTAYRELFELLWNVTVAHPDNAKLLNSAGVAVSRGANAAADWDALRRITLPDQRGRGIYGAGAGTDLTERSLLAAFGQESVLMTADQLPEHSHALTNVITHANFKTNPPIPNAVLGFPNGDDDYKRVTGEITTDTTGEEEPDPIELTGPAIAYNVMVKI